MKRVFGRSKKASAFFFLRSNERWLI